MTRGGQGAPQRAYTLVEMMAVIGLSVATMLVLYESIQMGSRWSVMSREVVSDDGQRESLQRLLRADLGSGLIVEGLALAGGRFEERDVAAAGQRWGFDGQALVLRGDDRYTVWAQEGRALVRRELSFDGHLSRRELLSPVEGIRFSLLRVEAAPRGVSWELTLPGGRRLGGVVAARRTEPGPLPPEPAPVAPRWQGRGGAR